MDIEGGRRREKIKETRLIITVKSNYHKTYPFEMVMVAFPLVNNNNNNNKHLRISRVTKTNGYFLLTVHYIGGCLFSSCSLGDPLREILNPF